MQKLLYLLSVTSLFSLDVYQTPPFHACLMISYIGTHIFRISFDSPDIKPFATMTIFKSFFNSFRLVYGFPVSDSNFKFGLIEIVEIIFRPSIFIPNRCKIPYFYNASSYFLVLNS